MDGWMDGWMVVNMNLFVPNSVIADTLLWIAEEIPGLVHSGDVSRILADQGYWGSYNIPFFQDVYNQSGYPAQEEKYGNDYSYEKRPPVRSFSNVMRRVWRTWMTPNVSCGTTTTCMTQSPKETPSEELLQHVQTFRVLIQSTLNMHSEQWMQSLLPIHWWLHLVTHTHTHFAVCGPTTDQQPAFQWSGTSFDSISHVGVPDRFHFDWQSF